MYLTEDEAKEKWCPYAFAVQAAGVRYLNDSNNNQSRCIASKCMMWRQYELSDEAKLGVQSEEEARIAYGLTERGYCGLAGKPE